MDWAKRIKEYRNLTGQKQQALADALGVDRTTISRWETGRDKPALMYRKRLLQLTPERDESIVRGLVDFIDSLDGFATLLDSEFRVLRTTGKHQQLMGHDPAAIYGKSSERYWSAQMERIIAHLGGLKGYRKLGVYRMDLTIARRPSERGSSNTQDLLSVGRTVAIGDPRDPVCHLTTLRLLHEAEAAPGCVIMGLDGQIPYSH